MQKITNHTTVTGANIKIDEEIEQLNQDRDLFSSIIRELYREQSDRSSDSEEEISELSIEIIPPETELKPKPVKSEKKKRKTKAQERQEALDKARAWVLERTRTRKKK